MGKKKKDVLDGVDDSKLKELKKLLINISKRTNLSSGDLLIENVIDIAQKIGEGNDINESLNDALLLNEVSLEIQKTIKERGILNP